MKNVALVVDIPSTYYAVQRRHPGARVNYGKVLQLAKRHGRLVRAVAFGSQLYEQCAAFVDCLHSMGFETEYRPDRDSRLEALGRELAQAALGANVIVLCSSDPDLAAPVALLRAARMRVVVIGCGIPKALWGDCVEINRDLLEGVAA